jgi:hypothetical protein
MPPPTTHQVVAFFDRRALGRKALAFQRQRMGSFERARMLAAQAGQRRRIDARLRGKLRRGRESCGNGQRCAIEEIRRVIGMAGHHSAEPAARRGRPVPGPLSHHEAAS